jgi:hypothetical protein
MRGLSCGEMGGRHAQNAICGEVGAGEGGRDRSRTQHARRDPDDRGMDGVG